MTAVAAGPIGVLPESNGSVVFVSRPAGAPVAVTSTVKEQLAPGAKVAPAKLIMFVAATAVIVPPPQDPVTPLGVATTKPAGSVSLKLRFVAEMGLGLNRLKVKPAVPPGPTPARLNAFVKLSGSWAVADNPLMIKFLSFPP